MRTLSQVVRTAASGEQVQPVELYDLYLDSETLHFAQYTEDIEFVDIADTATTYIALPIQRDPAKVTSDLGINSIQIQCANVDRAMSAYLASNEFRGRRLIIRKIFVDVSTGSGDAAVIFDGVMDAPTADEQWLTITAVDRIGTLAKECPKRWYQLLCNWKFAGTYCANGIAASSLIDERSGIVDSGTINQMVDAARTEANEYWIDGEIEFTSGDLDGIKRRIKSSLGSTIYFSTEVSEAPSAGDEYTIKRGCDKTWLRCSGDFSNDVNYGGFVTIPEIMVIR